MNGAELTVLIIDDQYTMRKIIREILKKIGITKTQEADSAYQALHNLLAGEEKPDLILCDLYMDRGGGIDLLKWIKNEPSLMALQMPIILLTGESKIEKLREAVESGAAGVLHKPCSAMDMGMAQLLKGSYNRGHIEKIFQGPTMYPSAATDITPPGGWRFTALAISLIHNKDAYQSDYKTGTISFGSYTLERGVRSVVKALPEAKRFVEVAPFPLDFIRGTHRDIVERSKEIVREEVERAEKDGRGLMLAFSVFGGPQALDAQELIHYAKKISEGRVVCIVGGPRFSARAPLLEADFFEMGADIVNIGGGKELAEWIGRLTKDDLFARDESGRLMASVPENAPFFSALSTPASVPGGDLPARVFYEAAENAIRVMLARSGCVNRCDFCAMADSLVRPHAPKEGNLAAEIDATINKVKRMFVKAKLDVAKHPIDLHIVNPNPTQGKGLDRFEALMMQIDMKEGVHLTHFFDALSFRTAEDMERHRAYLERLLTKNKNLKMLIGISLDALQEKGDGDFMGRRIAGRLVTQAEYDAIVENYRRFLKEISGQEWGKRLTIGLNQIYHPAMTADLYNRKKDLTWEIAKGGRLASQEYPLIPYDGTALAERHKGHFAPPSVMEKDWELGYALSGDSLSYWANGYKNADMLDCIEFCEMMKFINNDELFLYMLDAVICGWDDGEPKFRRYDFEDNEEGRKLNEAITQQSKIILNGRPRIVGVMKLTERFLEDRDWSDEKAITLAQALHASAHWFLRREKYVAQHDPEYARDERTVALIKEMEGMVGRLRALPCADKLDPRPQRSFGFSDRPGVSFAPV